MMSTLLLLSALGWVGEPSGLQVRPWLGKAGVRDLAVVFFPKNCPGCPQAGRSWQQLKDKYGPRGLRVVLVTQSQGDRCDQPRWADDVICNKSVIFTGYRAPRNRPSAVLWNWRGQIIGQGRLRVVKRALQNETHHLKIEVQGANRSALRRTLRQAVLGTGKFDIQATDRRPPGPSVGPCPAGHTPSMNLVLRARIHEARLKTALVDVAHHCAAAEIDVGVAGRDLPEAAREAMGRLIYPFIKTPQAPNLGGSPPATHSPSMTPRDTRAGFARRDGLVDPDRPRPRGGDGRSLSGFVQTWRGTRYQPGGDRETGIDGPHFAQALYKAVYGRDITSDLKRQLKSGPEVVFDPARPQDALRPGDLLFFVSYSYLPRSVMVYLGNGKVAHSVVIRGVVVDDAPKRVPDYLYLVARRPLAL